MMTGGQEVILPQWGTPYDVKMENTIKLNAKFDHGICFEILEIL